jgi:hypothetical protein
MSHDSIIIITGDVDGRNRDARLEGASRVRGCFGEEGPRTNDGENGADLDIYLSTHWIKLLTTFYGTRS